MPIRNPFRRAPGAEALEEAQRNATDNGFKNTAVSGAPPLQIKDTTEYKLSGEDTLRAFTSAVATCAFTTRMGAYCNTRDQRQRSLPARKILPLNPEDSQ